MTASGRTTWWPKDAAWHRRDRVVELGAEHGAAGPMVLDVICAWAQEQRHDGAVKGGFVALAREAFVRPDDARKIVEHAALIGAIDDLEHADQDRIFTCRVSGWESDQRRGRDAIKKAGQRADDPQDMSPSEGTTGGLVPLERDLSPLHNQTSTRTTASTSEIEKASPDGLRLCRLLAELVRQRDPKAKVNPESDAWLKSMRLLLADRDGDAGEVERVLRWSQADSFWQSNILSPGKLREKFTQLMTRIGGQVADLHPKGRLQHSGDFSRFDQKGAA